MCASALSARHTGCSQTRGQITSVHIKKGKDQETSNPTPKLADKENEILHFVK